MADDVAMIVLSRSKNAASRGASLRRVLVHAAPGGRRRACRVRLAASLVADADTMASRPQPRSPRRGRPTDRPAPLGRARRCAAGFVVRRRSGRSRREVDPMTPLTGARPVHPDLAVGRLDPARARSSSAWSAGRGGAGASTLAAALARHLARRTATVLVDLDRGVRRDRRAARARGRRRRPVAGPRGRARGGVRRGRARAAAALGVVRGAQRRPGAPGAARAGGRRRRPARADRPGRARSCSTWTAPRSWRASRSWTRATRCSSSPRGTCGRSPGSSRCGPTSGAGCRRRWSSADRRPGGLGAAELADAVDLPGPGQAARRTGGWPPPLERGGLPGTGRPDQPRRGPDRRRARAGRCRERRSCGPSARTSSTPCARGSAPAARPTAPSGTSSRRRPATPERCSAPARCAR